VARRQSPEHGSPPRPACQQRRSKLLERSRSSRLELTTFAITPLRTFDLRYSLFDIRYSLRPPTISPPSTERANTQKRGQSRVLSLFWSEAHNAFQSVWGTLAFNSLAIYALLILENWLLPVPAIHPMIRSCLAILAV